LSGETLGFAERRTCGLARLFERRLGRLDAVSAAATRERDEQRRHEGERVREHTRALDETFTRLGAGHDPG
jgi:hypothetical protein